MAPSLLVANLELLGATTNPEYRLAPGFGFGDGEPDQATIVSLYLDGEVIQGERRHNRHMQMPLHVMTGNGQSLSTNVDTLLQAVNEDTFEVQWTPSGGLPIVFDAYRATPSRPRDLRLDAHGRTALLLDFYAKPFGRSPILQSISAAGTNTQMDNFDASRTGSTLDNTIKYEGSGSARITLSSSLVSGARIYASGGTALSRTFGSAQDLTGMVAVTMRWLWTTQAKATMTGTLILTSAAGNATIVASKGFNKTDANWRLVSFPLTGNLGSLDLTAVTGYSLTFHSTAVPGGTTPQNIWVDDMRKAPPSSPLLTTTHGANLLLPSMIGSARAPANLELDAGGSPTSFDQFLLHSPPVDQDPDAQILTGLSLSSSDQTVTIPIAGAKLRGTYSLLLGGGTDGTAVALTVTVTQRRNGAGLGSGREWVATKSWDITTQGRLCPIGEITLPLFDTPDDNTATDYTIRVQVTNGGTDRFSEVMLLDTKGQTIYSEDSAYAQYLVYVDEPSPLQSGPSVYVADVDRSDAYSKLPDCVVSGGPILLEPGQNKLLIWTDNGTPEVSASYYPRWLDERLV